MWKFLNTGRADGEFNMSCDEQLVRELSSTEYEGVLRVYGWTPPCISLGFHQSFSTVDLDKCRREGIDVVRRPTGGRAILHWEELTYSVVTRAQGESLSEVYHSIGRALERGLQQLHREIRLSRPETRTDSLPWPSSNIPCYGSIARFELQYQGKKLVGSAQRRYQLPKPDGEAIGTCEIVLQHGSILLGPAHRRLVDFLAIKDRKRSEVLRKELDWKSTELSTILSRPVGFEEAAECVRHGFEVEWGIQFHPGAEGNHFPTTHRTAVA